MVELLLCNTERIKKELNDGLLDPRVLVALLATDTYMRYMTGHRVRLTSLAFDPEKDKVAGRLSNTLHRINPVTKCCEAADFNPSWTLSTRSLWEDWRQTAVAFIKKHFKGLDIVCHGEEDNRHNHLEADPKGDTLYMVGILPPKALQIRI